MATRTSTRNGPPGIGIVVDPAVYRRLAYLLLSFPLGLAYLVFLTVTLSLGAGLAIIGIGIPILFGSLLVALRLAAFECWRAKAMVGIEVKSPRDPGRTGGLLTRLRRLLGAETTWRSVGTLLFVFGFGTAGFVAAVALLTLALAMLTAPLTYDLAWFGLRVWTWEATTLPEALALVPVGAGLYVLGLHACDRLARFGGRAVASLLRAH